MKNKILIIVAGLLLLVFLTFGTYAWYLFFLRASDNYGGAANADNRAGGIVMDDAGNRVYDTDVDNYEGDNISDIPPYTFTIRNTDASGGSYTLYLEDVPVNSINDGCTEATLLDRTQLNYQLILNDKVIKQDSLDNIKDNVLDRRSIDGKKTNTYKLRIYIKEDADNWRDKHYHYKVTMNKEK